MARLSVRFDYLYQENNGVRTTRFEAFGIWMYIRFHATATDTYRSWNTVRWIIDRKNLQDTDVAKTDRMRETGGYDTGCRSTMSDGITDVKRCM
jgi:hypothetical protein